MDTLKLVYDDGLYRYDLAQTDNELLHMIATILTREIGSYDFYQEFLHEPSYTYSGNGYYIHKIDSYIIAGSHYGYDRVYMPDFNFNILIQQWHNAYLIKPNVIKISVDENKSFKIIYPGDELISINLNEIKSSATLNSLTEDTFIDIESVQEEHEAFETNNDRLNLFGCFLTSHILTSDLLRKLNEPPFEYYNDRYYFAVVEDRILIYDKAMEMKIFPRLDTFIDLMQQWNLAINNKPKLIRLYIDSDYDFTISTLQHYK